MRKIIIIGFDGLSYSKIIKYNCKELTLKEFGQININDFSKLITPTIWGSFITGKQQKFPSLTKMIPIKGKEKKDRILKIVQKIYPQTIDLRNRATAYPKLYDKEDLEGETIFDKFKSISIKVPGYDELQCTIPPYVITNFKCFSEEYYLDEVNKNIWWRLKKLKEANKLKNIELIMVHFHKWDLLQHLYFNNKKKEAELYKEANAIAKKLNNMFQHEKLLFLSDHGLDKGIHTYDAFYSSNFISFKKQPKITDFYKKIINT